MRVLPIILVTGFLGAGKTTFINQLISHFEQSGKNIALLVNEFGEISIDSHLIKANREAIYEVNQGSIFCVCTRKQFSSAITHIIRSESSYDLLIIESTGISETKDLENCFDIPNIACSIQVLQNFCLIDAQNFHKVYKTLPATKNQVEEASVCIINKVDLVSKSYLNELKGRIKDLNPNAEILVTNYGKISFSRSLNLEGYITWRGTSKSKVAPIKKIETLTLKSDRVLTYSKTLTFLQALKGKILRGKGILKTDKGPIFAGWAGDSWEVVPFKGESVGDTRLVLIGGQLNSKYLKEEFNDLCK